MPVATKVYVLSSMAEFLLDRYEAKKKEVRLSERRYYSQNEYAQSEIGMIPQTFGRYMNGEQTMTMDQAVLLLKHYGRDILQHFDYSELSSLDKDTAEIIASLAEMSEEKRARWVEAIRQAAEGDTSSVHDLLTA